MKIAISTLFVSTVLLLDRLAWALQPDVIPNRPGHGTGATPLPFPDYTASAIIMVLIVGAMVALLLVGGILIVNFGLMSKRVRDRVGGRTPSDVAVLKTTVWPEEPEEQRVFPAMGEEEEDFTPSIEQTGDRRSTDPRAA